MNVIKLLEFDYTQASARMEVNGVELRVKSMVGTLSIYIDHEFFYEEDWTPKMHEAAKLFKELMDKGRAEGQARKAAQRQAILAKLQ